MIFPDIHAFIETHITRRKVSIMQSDLLQHQDQLRMEIEGRSVLVIGGAGTIGMAFIREILAFHPGRLYVVDTNENGLTELTRDLRSTHQQFIPAEYKTYPMNFGDDVFRKMVTQEGPFDIVANFAAHKHVRSEKDHYAVEAMLDNNVFKTKQLLEFLQRHPPLHFFCVSTDKATHPVNVMGASKKLMEETLMAYSREFKISTARFANVAFSNGSLLDGYPERIKKKQPLSCPEDVYRYFVSPEESGQICLLACILGRSGDIFFPKLTPGDMIGFKSITLDFIRMLGMEVQICKTEEEAKQVSVQRAEDDPYPVYFFASETSGEKLFEEFYGEEDTVEMDHFSGLGIIRNPARYSIQQMQTCLNELSVILQDPKVDKAAIVAAITRAIPDFTHKETGINLDQKM